MVRSHLPVLPALLAVALMAVAIPALAAEAALSINVTLPPPGSVKVVPGASILLKPTFSTPCFAESGGAVELVFAQALDVARVTLDNGYGYRITAEPEGNISKLIVEIPDDAPAGVYDVVIEDGSGTIYVIPKAVYIGSVDSFSEIYIVHVTDRHFGVINSNGRTASNYDLAAIMLSLMMPENTVIIDTGDVADTSRVVEYVESISVDTLSDKPVIGIPGNHDHVGGSSNYVTYRGPWNFTLTIYGLYRVVGIDSGGDGYVTPDQAVWASSVLTSTPEKVKIVLFHHPHFTHMFGDVPFNFTLEKWEELLDLLLSKKPNSRYMYIYSSWTQNMEGLRALVKGIFEANASRILVLSGHVHLDSYAEVHRAVDGAVINYVVTTATGGSVRPGDYHGFRVIRVTSEGGVEFYGDGEFYTRHASFNLEKVHVGIVATPTAAGSYLRIDPGTRIPELLERTMLAVPLPRSLLDAGEALHVYMEGLSAYKVRCTAAGCVVYGYADEPPRPGFTYRLVVYTKPDTQPPVVEVKSISPKKPRAGQPVTVELRVSDDSWGIAEVEAVLYYNGGELRLIPSVTGDTVLLTIPPLKDVEKAIVEVKAVDMAGREAVKRIEVEYSKPAPAQSETTTTTTTTATATATLQVETTATTPATVTTQTGAETARVTATTTPAASPATTSPPATGKTETPLATPPAAPAPAETGTSVIIVAAIVVAALAYLAFMARRG